MIPDVAKPPRWLLLIAAVVLCAGVVASFVGAFHIGVSWDETYHVQRLRNFLNRGWYLIDTEMDGFSPGSWNTSTYVYGPVAALTLHWANVLLGGETGGHVDSTSFAFTVRHVGTAFYGLLGVLSTMGIARVVFRSWGWAVVTGAVLVAIPTWTGHSMFNIKDIPVASGCTMVTLGVALVVVNRRLWLAFVLMLLGCVVAIGTRPGIWSEIALVFAVGVIGIWRAAGAWRPVLPRVAVMVCAGLLSFLALALVYPHAFADPVYWMWHSATQSADFQGKPGKRWYLPLYLLIELPNLVFGLFLIGSWLLVKRFKSGEREQRLVLLLSFAQTVPLPVIAVITASNVYTGLRQFLFCAPGVAIAVTVAIAWLLQRRTLGRLVVAATLVVPMAAQLALFPFNYTYESMAATALEPVAVKIDPRLQVRTDYWRTSVRELAPHVPAGGFVVCSPLRRSGDFVRRSNETSEDCANDGIGPLQPYDSLRGQRAELPPTKFYAVDTGHERIGANCTLLGSVTRRLYWRKITLSTSSRCAFLPATYPGVPVQLTGNGGGKSFALSGWLARPAESGVTLTGSQGLVAFTLPTFQWGSALEITGHLQAPPSGPLTVTVNGTALPLTGATPFTISVPASVASADGAGRVLINFSGAGMRLYDIGLQAVPTGQQAPPTGQ